MVDDAKFTVLDSNESNMAKYVTRLVRTSKVLSEAFIEKTNQMSSSSKKYVKGLYFKLLRYEKLYEQRGTQLKENFERNRVAPMKEG